MSVLQNKKKIKNVFWAPKNSRPSAIAQPQQPMGRPWDFVKAQFYFDKQNGCKTFYIVHKS